MSNVTAQAVPPYFEESWAILSTIGLVNVLFGFMIIGITSLSPLTLVPIITSAAGCVANGLCYYAFYGNNPKPPTKVAAAFADIFWLIQEAGMSFYSYLILIRVLGTRIRLLFLCLFWIVMAIVVILRLLILVNRSKDIVQGNALLQPLINHLHIGYFSCIALIECIGAFFLLRKFTSAKKISVEAKSTSGLFHYLTHSTEVRLATLAAVGISRAITYSFQSTAQSASNAAGQVDRFVYTLECLFPTMMFIDVLASRLVGANHIHENPSQCWSQQLRPSSYVQKVKNMNEDIEMYPRNHFETRIEANSMASSSQERIVDGTASQLGRRESDREHMNSGGINKTCRV